jgi:recombination endonuclease VII
MPASMPATPAQAEWEQKAAELLIARRAEREAEREAEALRRFGAAGLAHMKALVAAAPPLTSEQINRLRPLLADSDPKPEWPSVPRLSGRSLNPKAGSLYAPHLRASDGPCGRCGNHGRREVDHCHEHGVVRGLICRNCNALAEVNMGNGYRALCGFCEQDAWLERRLAR